MSISKEVMDDFFRELDDDGDFSEEIIFELRKALYSDSLKADDIIKIIQKRDSHAKN